MKHSLLDRGALALGLTIGVCASAVLFAFFSNASSVIVQDRALLGAIIGGFISGLATLLATLVANYFLIKKAHEAERKELESLAETAFSKINTLRDDITKQYRHYFDSTPELQLHIVGRTKLHKPLRAYHRMIEFSDAEKALGLKVRRANVFNDTMDAQAIFDSMHFLKTEYEREFLAFEAYITENSPVSFQGRQMSTEAEVRPIKIVRLEDILENYRSFLLRTRPRIVQIHEAYIAFLADEFGRKIDWRESGEPAQSPNIYRE